ncbi:12960_t:CDS:2, partial [Entrophospora sp. SA101]
LKEDIDVIIITGSCKNFAFSVYKDVPWIHKLDNFISLIYNSYCKVKLVRICFGHQIIAKALGGKTLKNQLGWEVTVTNKTNKKVLMYQIQGMFKEEHVLTVQAHPEFVSGKGEGNN